MTDSFKRKPPARRGEYRHFHAITTRWEDNDVYGHINNVVYYSYVDTAVNRYLIENGFLDTGQGDVIGLAVENGCRFLKPMAFPDPVTVGFRVARIGNSSVRYEAALFSGDDEEASAEAYYVHVYVDRGTMRPTHLPEKLRTILEPLRVDGED